MVLLESLLRILTGPTICSGAREIRAKAMRQAPQGFDKVTRTKLSSRAARLVARRRASSGYGSLEVGVVLGRLRHATYHPRGAAFPGCFASLAGAAEDGKLGTVTVRGHTLKTTRSRILLRSSVLFARNDACNLCLGTGRWAMGNGSSATTAYSSCRARVSRGTDLVTMCVSYAGGSPM